MDPNRRERWTRRRFLQCAGAAGLAALGAGSARLLEPIERSARKVSRPAAATADRMILLWMAGGMPHTDTFDPKRYVPYETGVESKRVLSTFPSIDTSVDHIKFSEGLENIAGVMDRGTLIRSYRAADLGFVLHQRHQYHWHTGYVPPQTVAAPHIGAVIARTLGPYHPDVPAYIDIGQGLDTQPREELKAFMTAGFLGSEFGPMLIPDPAAALNELRPESDMRLERFKNRRNLYRKFIEGSPIGQLGSEFHRESLERSMENAFRLISSPAAAAFDLASEAPESYRSYDTSRFGLGCLLARRLVERGARFVEVTSEYVPFGNWDMHDNGHTRTIEMKRWIDRPVAQLISDLEERGLLQRTLVVLASEFSRDALIEGSPEERVSVQFDSVSNMTKPNHYGLHSHFTAAGSVLMFGGGVKKGFLYGATSDERPCAAVEKPVSIENLHATIYSALGIPADSSYEVEGRPFYVTNDGKGEVIEEILA